MEVRICTILGSYAAYWADLSEQEVFEIFCKFVCMFQLFAHQAEYLLANSAQISLVGNR